jgi:hypothetical protein
MSLPSSKYEFELTVNSLTMGVPLSLPMSVRWARGPRAVSTSSVEGVVSSSSAVFRWDDEPLTMISTLLRNASSGAWAAKKSKLLVFQRQMYNGHSQEKSVGHCIVNLADYAASTLSRRTFEFATKLSKCSDKTATLQLTLKARWMRELEDDVDETASMMSGMSSLDMQDDDNDDDNNNNNNNNNTSGGGGGGGGGHTHRFSDVADLSSLIGFPSTTLNTRKASNAAAAANNNSNNSTDNDTSNSDTDDTGADVEYSYPSPYDRLERRGSGGAKPPPVSMQRANSTNSSINSGGGGGSGGDVSGNGSRDSSGSLTPLSTPARERTSSVVAAAAAALRRHARKIKRAGSLTVSTDGDVDVDADIRSSGDGGGGGNGSGGGSISADGDVLVTPTKQGHSKSLRRGHIKKSSISRSPGRINHFFLKFISSS